jgi:hypothetical protein
MSVRSHHGCARCKRRRQKCGEEKPSCTRCLDAQVSCEYTIVLKWHGRIPRTSLVARRKLKAPEEQPTFNLKVSPGEENMVMLKAEDKCARMLYPLHLPQPSDPLPSAHRLLLHHFTTKVSLIVSHSNVRDQLCGLIIPLALGSQSLLYATMALSALHRTTLLNGTPPGFKLEGEIADLMSLSLRHLRQELQQTRGEARIRLLHTIRMLCTCEIFSGKADTSWRVHVQGAKAIIQSASTKNTSTEVGTYASHNVCERADWLTSSWFFCIEALTALTTNGLLQGQVEVEEPYVDRRLLEYLTNDPNEDYYLDLYPGYSSDLNKVLREIGAGAWERRRFESAKALQEASDSYNPTHHAGNDGEALAKLIKNRRQSPDNHSYVNTSSTILSEADLQREAFSLEQSLLAMIQRDLDNGVKVPPGVSLSDNEFRQFCACNTVYQYSALIFVYRRVRMLSSESLEVQDCVNKIIETAASILPVVELSVWVLLTTPVFTAGYVDFNYLLFWQVSMAH